MATSNDEGHLLLATHEERMKQAIEEARLAMEDGEVPVGCIFLDESTGQIVARGRNATNKTRNATRHCEIVAADSLIEQEGVETALQMLGRSRLYVTLEPCIMCAGALQHLGVSKVVFGASNDRFGGCGGVFSVHEVTCQRVPADSLQDADAPRRALTGFSVVGGVLAQEAVQLLKDFYDTGNPNAPDEKRHRPLVPTKMATAGTR